MPKLGTNFEENLSIACSQDLKEKLTTLAYMREYSGQYNKLARDLLIKAADVIIRKMEPGERRQYDQILENVRAEMVVKRHELEEKLKIRRAHANRYQYGIEENPLDDFDPDMPRRS